MLVQPVRWKWGLSILLLSLAAEAGCSRPQVTAADPVEGEDKVKEVARALLPHFDPLPPRGLTDHFAESFLKTVTPKQLAEAFQSFHPTQGRATEVRLVRMTGPYQADIEFVFEKGFLLPTSLTLDSKPPHKVTGLFFKGAVKDDDTVESLTAELKALPGTTAFTLIKLGPSPKVVWERNGDRPMAVASSFKLFVFAALVEQINKGERAWSDVVTVRKEWASLPSGLIQDWPDGSPVTVHTLATLMIAKSDNTAADHLFRLVGRDRIEAVQKTVGVKEPERNRPFLNTGEMFKIKYVLTPEQQREYTSASADERRKLLDTKIKETSLARPRKFGSPQLINEVEWFFSTSDMCRAVAWLHAQEKVPQAQEILAINNGLSLDQGYWTYAGYKAGAEPGVLVFTLLLQNKAGEWFAFSLAWNDPERDVDTTKLIVLAQRLIRLAQRQAK